MSVWLHSFAFNWREQANLSKFYYLNVQNSVNKISLILSYDGASEPTESHFLSFSHFLTNKQRGQERFLEEEEGAQHDD